jgi:hypothetical protein
MDTPRSRAHQPPGSGRGQPAQPIHQRTKQVRIDSNLQHCAIGVTKGLQYSRPLAQDEAGNNAKNCPEQNPCGQSAGMTACGTGWLLLNDNLAHVFTVRALILTARKAELGRQNRRKN